MVIQTNVFQTKLCSSCNSGVKLELTIHLERHTEPIEIAKLVLFLASNDSQFTTGTTQVIDGGFNVNKKSKNH